MKKSLTTLTSVMSYLSLITTAHAGEAGSETNFSIPQDQTGLQITSLPRVITSGINILIMLAGILLFIFLVWGGIQWLTSGGDKNNVEAARNRITAALIGLAIVALAWALQALISYFFGIGDIGALTDIPKPY